VTAWLIAHQGLARMAIVGGLLVLLLAWQQWRPRRAVAGGTRRRFRNIAMTLVSSALVYLILPATAVAFAAQIADTGFGLFNSLSWPVGVEIVAGVILLDLAIYWQHRWSHRVPVLWRLHRVHHSDIAFDATLGLRFHPAEILLSLLYKLALVAVLGIAPLTMLFYEILLASFALFTHADVAIAPQWDRRLRRVFVTPDWHRVHHSVHRDETDSNYGNILGIWDHLFTSYRAQPREGHLAMEIGLAQFRDAQAQTLPALLRQPLVSVPVVTSHR